MQLLTQMEHKHPLMNPHWKMAAEMHSTGAPAGLTLQGTCPTIGLLPLWGIMQQAQGAQGSIVAFAAHLEHVRIGIICYQGCCHVA